MVHLRGLARQLLCFKRTDIDGVHELPPARPERSSPNPPHFPNHSQSHGARSAPPPRQSTDSTQEDADLMPPKRKNANSAAATEDADKKTKVSRKSKRLASDAEEVYSSQQKAAIQQFISFTQVDRNTAVRALKTHGWDAQNAVNAYYSGGGAPQASSAVKSTLNTLFDKYQVAGAQDKDIVGVDGTFNYFQHIDVNPEGLEALAALEIVQAPTMGEMSREGFVKGWSERNCETIAKQKDYIQDLKRRLPENKEVFTRVYKYTFPIARAAGQKAVALEDAVLYWELLFASPLSAVKWSSESTPWLSWWTEFVTSEWKKSVNKDMWNETLKFAQLTLDDETLGFWNEEASWPSVIDEFVEWVKREKREDTKEEVMDEEY